MKCISLVVAALSFFVALAFVKIHASRERAKRNSAMLEHLKRVCPEEFGQ